MILFAMAVFFLVFMLGLTIYDAVKISKRVGRFNLTVCKYAALESLSLFSNIWQQYLSNLIPCNSRFVNHTSLPDSALEDAWTAAQNGLATASFPLNVYGTDSQMHSPDPRALTIAPSCVIVREVSDVSVSELAKLDPTWAGKTDPSKEIILFGNPNTLFCHSYVALYKRPRVYAVSSEAQACLPYEFQNIILTKLGYSTATR
jgi:hypothetical protein